MSATEYLRARKALISVRDVEGGAPLAMSLYAALEDNDLGSLLALSAQAEQLLEFKAAQWRAQLHPRDWHGRFAHTPGTGGKWPTTGSEFQALSTWTGAQSHEIQAGYENGKPKTQLARRFDAALMAIPPRPRGRVLRGLNLDLRDPEYPTDHLRKPEDVAAHFRARIGEVLSTDHPESASTAAQNMEQLTLGPGARVVYEIDTARARDIAPYAAHREAWESEAVVPPGRFRIDGVEIREFPVISAFAGDRSKPIRIPVVSLTDITDERHLSDASVPAAITRETPNPSMMTPAQQAQTFGFHISSGGDAVPGGYNGYLQARDPDSGEVMGKIDYQTASSPYNEGLIAMVTTSPRYQHHGVATNLFQALRAEFPEYEWRHGFTTEEGSAWLASLPEFLRQEPVPPLREAGKAWTERLHPRDDHGRFSHTPGAGASNLDPLTAEPQDYWAEEDAPFRAPPGFDPWTKGHFGKGFLVGGEPFMWNVSTPDLSPHHDDAAEAIWHHYHTEPDASTNILMDPLGDYCYPEEDFLREEMAAQRAAMPADEEWWNDTNIDLPDIGAGTHRLSYAKWNKLADELLAERHPELKAADWREQLHPRDWRGEFAHKPGGGGRVPSRLAGGYAQAAQMLADKFAQKAQDEQDKGLAKLPDWLASARDGDSLDAGTVVLDVRMWDTGKLRVTVNSRFLEYPDNMGTGAYVDDPDAIEALTASAQKLTDKFKATTLTTQRKQLRGSIAADKGVDGKRAYKAVRDALAENEGLPKFTALRDRFPQVTDDLVLISEKGYGRTSLGINDVFVTAARTREDVTGVNALAMAVQQRLADDDPNFLAGRFGPHSVKPGDSFTATRSPAGTLRHEWAHGLWSDLSDEQRSQFASMLPQRTMLGQTVTDWDEIAKGLSQYAAGDIETRSRYLKANGETGGYLTETFAEATSLTTGPYYKPDEWPDWVQRLGLWINQLEPA